MKKIIKLLLVVACLYCCFNYQNIDFIQEIIDIYHYQQELRNQGKDVIQETMNYIDNYDVLKEDEVMQEDDTKLNQHNGTYKQYYYESLNEEDKILYKEIFESICLFKTSFPVSSNDMNKISDIITMISNDNPNLYYFNPTQDQFTLNTNGNDYTLKLVYSMSEDEVNKMDQKINEIVQPVIDETLLLPNEYEKVKKVFDFIIDHCEYVEGAKDNQNILSVLIHQESVCAGYARTLKHFFDLLNIESCVLVGSTEDARHATVMARIDGHYYYFDPTWGDPIKEKDIDYSHYNQMRYSYFAMSHLNLNRYFQCDNKDVIQKSTSNEANYFIQNHLFITNLDEFYNLLKAQSDKTNITFMCENESLYKQIIDAMEHDTKVLEILSKGFAYQCIDDTYTISIILN